MRTAFIVVLAFIAGCGSSDPNRLSDSILQISGGNDVVNGLSMMCTRVETRVNGFSGSQQFFTHHDPNQPCSQGVETNVSSVFTTPGGAVVDFQNITTPLENGATVDHIIDPRRS